MSIVVLRMTICASTLIFTHIHSFSHIYYTLLYPLFANLSPRVRRVVHGGLQRIPADAGHQAGESVHRPGDGVYALGATGMTYCCAILYC